MKTMMIQRFYIGWDVGGWNCDKNQNSRDAIVILDANRRLVGKPIRTNLRTTLTRAATATEWVGALFDLCESTYPGASASVTVAIDTPLGFSREFVALVTRQSYAEPADVSGENRYLYRATERHLYRAYGKQALSAVKDMIGSQATKGLHALAKFAPVRESLGVWTDGYGLRVIEAYPALAKESKIVQRLHVAKWRVTASDDIDDAGICAFVAWLFENRRDALDLPPDDLCPDEGWIWVPKPDAR